MNTSNCAYVCGFNGFKQISSLREASFHEADIHASNLSKRTRIKERTESETNSDSQQNPVSTSTMQDENFLAGSRQSMWQIDYENISQSIEDVKVAAPTAVELLHRGDKILSSWSSLIYASKGCTLEFIVGSINTSLNKSNIWDIFHRNKCEGKKGINGGECNEHNRNLRPCKTKIIGVGNNHMIVVASKNEEESSDITLRSLLNAAKCDEFIVSVGEHHTIGLRKNDGKLFSLILREYGGDTKKEILFLEDFVINPIDLNFKITSVSCGKEHALMLSEGGLVLTYGLGSRGQLGHGSTDPVDNPHVVEVLEPVRIITISAGGWHSLALADTGDIYAWGWNESGQLGIALSSEFREKYEESNTKPLQGNLPQCQVFPCLVEFPIDVTVTHISCGSRHSAAISDIGHLWTWGWNKYGQLGHGDFSHRISPTRCTYYLDRKIKLSSVYCYSWTTIAYSSNVT